MSEVSNKKTAVAVSDEYSDPILFAIAAARVAAENRAEDVEVLDLRGLSSLADVFVIGTGTSDRQMGAVVEHIRMHARDIGRKQFRVSGLEDSAWVLADYVDVIIHLFDPEHRSFYDLDSLWGDAPRIDWRPAAAPSADE